MLQEEETPAEGNSSQQPGIQDKPEAGSQRIEATTLEALQLSFSNRGQNHRRRSVVDDAFSGKFYRQEADSAFLGQTSLAVTAYTLSQSSALGTKQHLKPVV